MTIEDLSIIATDQENFSHEGQVVVTDNEKIFEVVSAHYDANSKHLVIIIA
jgi:hypothetical protein